ncbi:unnamed protein product [Caenorhabditis nigoni]
MFFKKLDPPKEPKKLTNLSSICVLEYLSFDKRLYVVSQVTEFRKVEKSLPLHLNDLAFLKDRIRIDQYEYCLTGRLRRALDFNQNYPTGSSLAPWIIELRKRQNRNPPIDSDVLALMFPIHDDIKVANEKLIFDLIGNRPMIYTKILEFRKSWDYPLPADLKIQADIIEGRGFHLDLDDLDRISKILGPKPLKEFSTQLHFYPILTHPIVRNSRKLVLWRDVVDFDQQRVNHRNIHLKDYSREALMNHMNAWIANGPDVGMEFTGDIEVSDKNYWKLMEEEKLIKKMMYLKKCESGGKRVKADERFSNTLYSISMPRTNNPNLEIQMSLIKNGPKLQIHLKIQPSGTAIPEKIDSMSWELKLLEIRKIFQTCESQSLPGQLFVGFMYFLCYFLFIFSFYSIIPEKKTK